MTSKNSTWRVHPFKQGYVYTAIESFKGVPEDFLTDVDYVFDGTTYSHYDSSTVFTFHMSGKNTPIQWWWHDEDSESCPFTRFKPYD